MPMRVISVPQATMMAGSQRLGRSFLRRRLLGTSKAASLVVLVGEHVEVFLQALDLGVADVAPVEEGEAVEQCERGDEAQVHLAEDFGLVQVSERMSDKHWLSDHLAGSYKRSAGMAIQIGVGNLDGATASNFYRQPDSPRYVLGHALEIAFVCAGIVAAVILNVGYTASNRRRVKTLAEGGEDRFGSWELSETGDKACTFRYMH
ncbi:hypothetical protein VPNG_09322 [Cytospora leucostoma]|uniref:Uncharacterized protein n=1 Tax=Cytospora leucostoma TaxID=1230097 RepID=A0A423VUX3_9PEZI|nr:hypothetical protein VPNG_09322 [Cytospora leucostoma]